MKYLQKVIAFPTELEDSVLYYSTEMDKVAIKPNIQWVLDPTRYIEEDGKYYEYWYDPTQRQVIKDDNPRLVDEGGDTYFRDSSKDKEIDGVTWYWYSYADGSFEESWHICTIRNESGLYEQETIKWYYGNEYNIDEAFIITLYLDKIVDGATKKGNELPYFEVSYIGEVKLEVSTINNFDDCILKVAADGNEVTFDDWVLEEATRSFLMYLPNNVETIKYYINVNKYNAMAKTNEFISFVGGVTNIIIPKEVEALPHDFVNSKALSSITIPNNITYIGDNAFDDCYFTKDNFINNSSLDAEANYYWEATFVDEITSDGLCILNNEIVNIRQITTSIVIPSTVTRINNGFFNYSNLSSITSLAMNAPSVGNVFEDVAENGVLHVPQGATGYDKWMQTWYGYLGSRHWTIQYDA